MAVTVTSTISGPYFPNGVTTVFAFDFKAGSADEIEVYRDLGSVDGWELVPDADYTASVDPDEEGGTVEFSVAPSSVFGDLYIVSAPLFTREGQYTGEGPFTPKGLNNQFDRAAVRDLALARDVERGIKVPLGEEAAVLPRAADRIGKFISFGPTGDIVMAGGIPDTTFLGAEVVFTATEGQSLFVLTGPPKASVFVYANGVRLAPTDFNVAGKNVTLNEARAEGDVVAIVIGEAAVLPIVSALDVTFSPVSAPAVRTGQEKLREIVSIDDYYKTGDSDDSASLLRLRDRLRSTGGFTAYAPKSAYLVSEEIDFSGCNNSEIIGRGATNYGRYATVIRATAAIPSILKIDDPAGPTAGFKLKGLGFDGGGVADRCLDTRALWAWDFQHLGIYNALEDGWFIDVGQSGFNSQQGFVRKMVIDMGFDAASVNCNGFHIGPGGENADTCQSEMYDVQIQCRNGTGYIGGAADTLCHYMWKVYRMPGATGKLVDIPGGTNAGTFDNWYQGNLFVGLETKVLDGSASNIFCVGGPAAPARMPELNHFGMLDQSAPNYPEFFNDAVYLNSISDEKGYVLQRGRRRHDRDGRITFGGNIDVPGVAAAHAAMLGESAVQRWIQPDAPANRRWWGWDVLEADGKLSLSAFNDLLLAKAEAMGFHCSTTGVTGADLPWLPGTTSFANDAAAAAGGVPVGGLYRNGSTICVRVV